VTQLTDCAIEISDSGRAHPEGLRELRAEHGISQDQLARKTGAHTTAIGRLEHGEREPA
jgi:DNA-binding XRE family transcriptional regulator